MNVAVSNGRLEVGALSDAALRAAARFWFITAAAGQLIFAAYVAVRYGGALISGDPSAWYEAMPSDRIAGDAFGNLAMGSHLLLAILIHAGGPLQLIPQLRARYPVLHRWNGRTFATAALIGAVTGLVMMWTRGTVGDLSQHIGISLNAVVIVLCVAMAVRHARARNFALHRRWALRLFLVASGVWFFRVGLMFWLVVNGGPVGFDPKAFVGPFLTFLAFAQYLLPLAILELYFHAQDRGGAALRYAVSATIVLLTIATGVGIFGASMGMWLPRMGL